MILMAIVAGANAYFNERLGADAWDSATNTQKEKAIAQAERELKIYRNKVNATSFSYAIYEQALFLLEKLTGAGEAGKRAELQQQGVTSFSAGGLSESYTKTPAAMQGIAPEAQKYLSGGGVRGGRLI